MAEERVVLVRTEREKKKRNASKVFASNGSYIVRKDMITEKEINTKIEEKFEDIPLPEKVLLVKQIELLMSKVSDIAEGNILREMTLVETSLELYFDRIAIELKEGGRTPSVEHEKCLKLEAELKKADNDKDILIIHLWNFIDAVSDKPRCGSVYKRSEELLPVARIHSQSYRETEEQEGMDIGDEIGAVARNMVKVALGSSNFESVHSLAAITTAVHLLCDITGYTKEDFSENLIKLGRIVNDG